jgi:hypothetical protein
MYDNHRGALTPTVKVRDATARDLYQPTDARLFASGASTQGGKKDLGERVFSVREGGEAGAEVAKHRTRMLLIERVCSFMWRRW